MAALDAAVDDDSGWQEVKRRCFAVRVNDERVSKREGGIAYRRSAREEF